MKFNFENLDQETRDLMTSEIKSDIDSDQLYKSKRFNDNGNKLYSNLLLDSVNNGDEATLAEA